MDRNANGPGRLAEVRTARPPGPVRMSLLAGCDARGNEADVVDVGLVAHVDHFGDLAEVKGCIALDEHHLLLAGCEDFGQLGLDLRDRKSTRLNSSHLGISYAV